MPLAVALKLAALPAAVGAAGSGGSSTSGATPVTLQAIVRLALLMPSLTASTTE